VDEPLPELGLFDSGLLDALDRLLPHSVQKSFLLSSANLSSSLLLQKSQSGSPSAPDGNVVESEI
jgi:hypothetical protein